MFLMTPSLTDISHTHPAVTCEGEGSEEGEALFQERGGTLRAAQRQGFGVSSSAWGSGDRDQVMTTVSL